ncbi:MAG: hypothetical protein ACOC1F_13125 [Myxococcota bacterium]
MRTSFFFSAIAALVFATGCSSAPDADPADPNLPDDEQGERGPLGKADASGTCQGEGDVTYCGGKGNGVCYCDDACEGYGDCCADYEPVCKGTNPPPPETDAITCAAAGNVCHASPAGAAVYRIYREAIRDDGTIDQAEANHLAAFLRGSGGQNADVKTFLDKLVNTADTPFAPGARELVEAFAAGTPPNWVPLENDVYVVKTGSQDISVMDDTVYLVGQGKLSGHSNSSSHSRGYAKKADGPLRFPHGSKAPAHPTVDSSAETSELRSQSPAIALDKAAQTAGLQLGQFGFDYRATERFYNPSAQYWEGLCHSWSYGALDERINALVDVDGPAGQRGIWIFGQWLSRADLGNWMMGVSDQLGIADTELVDPFVTPLDILKGVPQWVMTSGLGMRADMFNDAAQGTSEVWNQPIIGAELEVSSVSQTVADAVVAHAMNDSAAAGDIPVDPSVKLVQITVAWGAEVTDSHEGEPSIHTSDWNMYFVTAADGEAIVGYMANHLEIAGLPVATSDPLPDYFAYPKNIILDASFESAPNTLLEGALDGGVFRFYVGTVLAYGVPETTRAAFEADFVAGVDATTLQLNYPNIANAYSPEQWDSVFASKLGAGTEFGAKWGTFTNPG